MPRRSSLAPSQPNPSDEDELLSREESEVVLREEGIDLQPTPELDEAEELKRTTKPREKKLPLGRYYKRTAHGTKMIIQDGFKIKRDGN